MTRDRAREILETYPLSELLEDNEITEEDLLIILVEHGEITLPETQPL